MSAAPAAARPAPRKFTIGEKRPLELTILRTGEIRMREEGRRRIYRTSVATIYFAAVRSQTLTDIRTRQRRANLLTQLGNGGSR